MKIYLSGAPPAEQAELELLFQGRGHEVLHSESAPPDADVYLLAAGQEVMKQLTHGLVILDLRQELGQQAAWVPYADLCLVHNAAARAELVDGYGCEPERVFLMADNKALPDLVERAMHNALPPAEAEKRETTMTEPSPAPIESPGPHIASLAARLAVMDRQADVMHRDYRVRSRLPFIGPLVAWTRRNLTSHLREPYLDPTLERQVAINRELALVLREMLHLQANLEGRLARLEQEQDHDRD